MTRRLEFLLTLLVLAVTADAISHRWNVARANATAASPDTEYLVLPLGGDEVGAVLYRRVGDRLEGLGEIRQGKDRSRWLWRPGRTVEIVGRGNQDRSG